MNSFLDKESRLNIVLLLVLVVLSGTRIKHIGWMSVRCLDSVDPEILLPLSCAQKVLIGFDPTAR